ncbi:MAG: sugar ABC transporter substrate-binding protein [Anaerococcus prevotii]|nr:sugar ABC transporter substrate-binding protein [Anaerococcus prevotii]
MRTIKKMLFAVAAATMLTGCGGNESKDNADGGNNNGKSVVRMAMWNPDQIEVMKEIEKNYEEKNPDIDIQIEETTFKDHFTKLETQSQGKVMPDIFTMNGPNFVKFASNGVLEPLDDHMDKLNFKKEDFPVGLIDLYTYEDKLYGIPKDWDLTALFYNKEIFDEAGVEYPNEDWTWDDFVKAAEKLTNKEKGIWGTAAKGMTQEGIYDTIPQSGGYIISEDKQKSGYDSPEAESGVKIWTELIEKGISPDLQTLTDTSDKDLFKAGKIAMVYLGSWRVPEFFGDESFKDKVDVQIMPLIKDRAATIHGLSYALAKDSENKDAALDFMAYLASEEVNELWASKGTVIPALNSSLNTWEASYPDKNLKAFVDELEYSVPYPVSKNTPVWNQYESDAINEIFSLERPAKDSLKDLADNMNSALSEE